MAEDAVQFLRDRFSRSVAEAESELASGGSAAVLFSFLKTIKDKVTQKQINREADWTSIICILTKLNDASDECRILANECKELNKKFSFFNWPSTIYSIRKMKKHLTTLERQFATLVDKPYTKKESQVLEFDDAEAAGNFPPEFIERAGRRASAVYDLEQTTDEIWGLLDGDGGFTAIGIVGMAGMGKTTLVQEVLKDERVKREFDPIIDLCLSEEEEEARVVKRLLEKLWPGEDTLASASVGGVGSLLERLKHGLTGKRYLIVLDDVWDVHMNHFYSDLSAAPAADHRCLSHGLPKGNRSAVIATSRIQEVAQHMVGPAAPNNNLILLKPCDTDTCYNIFGARVGYHIKQLTMSVIETLFPSDDETKNNLEEEIKYRCQGVRLAAKILGDTIPLKIRWLRSNRMKEMYIPVELFMVKEHFHSRGEKCPIIDIAHRPECPVLVLIGIQNKQLGGTLFGKFCHRFSRFQVFPVVLEQNSDSGEELEAQISPDNMFSEKELKAQSPESVLDFFYSKLEFVGRRSGYEIQNKLRIIIVGGDAVANWILKVICDLNMPWPPLIALIAPHETENNIASSFGWEKLKVDGESVNSFLHQVRKAKPMRMDSWHVLIKMKDTRSLTSAHQQKPHFLHVFSPPDENHKPDADNPTLCGGFWNYFSLEMIVEEKHEKGVHSPMCYGACCFHRIERTLPSFAKLEILKHDGGPWETLDIRSIRLIVCLNLPSFQSGLNPWEILDTKKNPMRGLNPPFIDDGRLEIIGSNDDLPSRKKKWIRLGQVRGIRFELIEGAKEAVNMSMDGATWEKMPVDGIALIEISYNGQVNILAHPTRDCPAKSIHVDSSSSSQPRVSQTDVNNKATELAAEAASTSKLPIDENKTTPGHGTFRDEASTSKIPNRDGNAEDYHEPPRHKKFGAAKSFKNKYSHDADAPESDAPECGIRSLVQKQI